jgi:septal ring factor EnvC (AmiA/AmiB activator)
MADSDLKKYKGYVARQLNKLSPFLQRYAFGDFSKNVPVPEEENEFTELLVGLNLMVDDIKELIDEKENTILKLNQAKEELNQHKENLEKLIEKRTAQLKKKNKELLKKNKDLEHYNELFIGREIRIKELKDKIRKLENRDYKI